MKEYSKKRSAKARPVDVAGGVTVKRSNGSNGQKAQAAPVNTVHQQQQQSSAAIPTTHALTAAAAAAALPYSTAGLPHIAVTQMSVTPMTVSHHHQQLQQQQQQGAVPQLLPTFGSSSGSGSSAGGTFSAVAANAAAGLRQSDVAQHHHSDINNHINDNDNDNDDSDDGGVLEQLPEDTVMCGHPSRPHYKTGLCQVQTHIANILNLTRMCCLLA
jgi:hypothetical protein